MKKIIFVILVIVAITTTVQAKSYGPQHDKVVAIFQSKAEPTAKDAVWTAQNIFKIGVVDDGSSRYGYAMYACEVLAENGIRGTWVQIIDIHKLMRTSKWVKLGETHCR